MPSCGMDSSTGPVSNVLDSIGPRVWHACADGRIGESCQLVAIQPANPWDASLVTAGNAWNGRAGNRSPGYSDVRRVGFPPALRAARIGHRDEHAVMRFRAEPNTPRALAYGIMPSASW